MSTLTVEPLIPGILWALLAVVSAGALAGYLLIHPPRISRVRRAVLGGLLAIGIGALLTVLLNPTWQRTRQSGPGRPPLAILVDTSASMATGGRESSTRLETSSRLARRLQSKLQEEFEVSLWTFHTDLQASEAEQIGSLSATGSATDLAGCVRRGLESGTGEEGAVVVLSDGIHNVGDSFSAVRETARAAEAMATPVFTRTVGTDASIEDTEVTMATPENLGFIGQTVPIRALIRHTGSRNAARVTLSRAGKELESKNVRLADDGSALVEFEVECEDPGLFRYAVRVEPTSQEVVRSNNRGISYLRVIEEPINVLVLEGKPYWDFKFLMRRLAEDEGLRVTGAVRVRRKRVFLRKMVRKETENAEGTVVDERLKHLPRGEVLLNSPEKLRDYNILVLGREVGSFLTPECVDNIARWISEQGGSLVCARGRPVQRVSERLDALMPVRWEKSPEQRFRIHMTREASRIGWLPVRAPLMPSLETGAAVERVKPLATVLGRAGPDGPLGGMPVITTQRYGAGRVIVMQGSGLWRWAVSAGKGKEKFDKTFGEFWGSLLRWLAASTDIPPGSSVAVRPMQRKFTTTERPVLQVLARDTERFSGSGPKLHVVSGENGQTVRKVRASPSASGPNLFEASLEPLPAGWYKARVAGRAEEEAAECAFDVSKPRREKLDLRARPELMRLLAEESGGRVVEEKMAEQIKSTYAEQWKERHPEVVERTSAWDRWPWLLAIGAVMGVAWIVRRSGGLV